jgi:hypothetical protein
MQCLGPYQVECSLNKISDFVLIDNTKTVLFAIKYINNSATEAIPYLNSVLIHEETKDDITIKYYEAIEHFGREYTINFSGCEVLITNFKGAYNYLINYGLSYSVKSFCFNRDYVLNTSQNNCLTTFVFDNTLFKIKAQESTDFGIFDCSFCDQNVSVFDFEEFLPEAVNIPESLTQNNIFTPEQVQNYVLWNNDYQNKVDENTVCNDETQITTAQCYSLQNPNIAILQDGSAIVASEYTTSNGTTSIKLYKINTSIKNKIAYYRKKSKGRLINDSSFVYGMGLFEIYEDINLNLTKPLSLGFLNGPLAGKNFFNILSVSREEKDNRFIKYIISFDSSNRFPDFNDSNDVFNISYILLTNEANESLKEISLTFSDVPLANPCVYCDLNNNSPDGSQSVYLTYSAFENNTWSVYCRHLLYSENAADIVPVYKSPYIFSEPSTVSKYILGNYDSVTYKAIKEKIVGNVKYIIFYVYLTDGRQVYNCNKPSGNFTHSSGLIAPALYASVQVVFDITHGRCSSFISVGDELTGSVDFESVNFGDCVISKSANISTSNWCFDQSECSQYYLINDLYCPSPYLEYINVYYKPIDLWTIQVDDHTITRVSYNLQATIIQDTNQADFENIDILFVIDTSSSMSEIIAKIRNSISVFSNNLSSYNVKFNLCCYGRSISALPVPNGITCNNTVIFNALQANSACVSDCENISNYNNNFTDDISVISNALCCWGNNGLVSPHWSAIQYCDESNFNWRSDSKKYIVLFTDGDEYEVASNVSCSGILNSKEDAILSLINKDITCITFCKSQFASKFNTISPRTGWEGDSFYNIDYSNYNLYFTNICNSINSSLSHVTIFERDKYGYDACFLKPAEVIITYNGDLTEYWTQDKDVLAFIDIPPVLDSETKGISNIPFNLYLNKIYNINPVQCIGNINNWVYFQGKGNLYFDFPSFGAIATKVSDNILIKTNALNAIIKTSNKNKVFICYETLIDNETYIEITGTYDIHYSGLIGINGNRITKLTEQNDFISSHIIGKGFLCDFCIDLNDVIHVCWTSKEDGNWEIYYANSSNNFNNVKITNSNNRSFDASIDINNNGDIYIVYSNNTFGIYQSFLAYKSSNRIIPLYEQDPYLAALRSDFIHYTNKLPIFIQNNIDLVAIEGKLLISLTENSNRNILSYNGVFETVCNGCSVDIKLIAGTYDGDLYGISTDAKLYKIYTHDEQDPYLAINVDNAIYIGDVNLEINPFGVFSNPIVVYEEFTSGSLALNWMKHGWNESAGNGSYSNNSLFYCLTDNRSVVSMNCSATISSAYLGVWDLAVAQYVNKTPGNIKNQRVELVFKYPVIVDNSALTGGQGSPIKIGISFRKRNIATDSSQFPYYVALIYQFKENGVFYLTSEILIFEDFNKGTVIDSTTVANQYINTDSWHKLTVDCFNSGNKVKFKFYINNIYVSELSDNNPSDILLGEIGEFPDGYYCGIHNVARTWIYLGNITYSYPFNDSFIMRSLVDIPVPQNYYKLLDLTFDKLNRLWLSAILVNTSGELVLKIINIDTSNANIIRDAIIFNKFITSDYAGLTSDSNGNFYISLNYKNQNYLYKSSYPALLDSSAVFSFNVVSVLNSNIKLLTFDYQNLLYGSNEHDIYNIDVNNGLLTSVNSLNEDPYIIDEISSLAYLHSGRNNTEGSSGYFHVIIYFYNNKNMLGDPVVVVDSRYDLESFLNEDPYFVTPNGLFLNSGESQFIHFNSGHDNVICNKNIYPYSFEKNITYFPKVVIIKNDISYTNDTNANISFSCNLCSSKQNKNINVYDCFFDILINENGIYNFVIDIYSDSTYKNLLNRYYLFPGSSDLEYTEVNNEQAKDKWVGGLFVESKSLVQFYPGMDRSNDFACGLNYYIKVFRINNSVNNINKINSSNITLFSTGIFKCDCPFDCQNSGDVLINRWDSSSFGYSANRINNTTENCFNPIVKTREENDNLITFIHNKKLKVVHFNNNNQLQYTSSGNELAYDLDIDVNTTKYDIGIDILNRPVFVYQKNKNANNVLNNFDLYYKICDSTNSVLDSKTTCDIENKNTNININSEFVNKIKLLPEYIQYFTVNNAGQTVPVVNVCDIEFILLGSPDIVAYQIKNEDSAEFSNWCQLSNELTGYQTLVKWSLSKDSGSKKITIQLMHYDGLLSSFDVNIIADYVKTEFSVIFYKDANYSVPLPTYNGFSVASTDQESTVVYVELIPKEKISFSDNLNFINYNVIQQGSNNLYYLRANEFINSSGLQVFRGYFNIFKEDLILNKDGFAAIEILYSGLCGNKLKIIDSYEKDYINSFNKSISIKLDPFKENRQSYGKIGVDIQIRPLDDPYLIFGFDIEE